MQLGPAISPDGTRVMFLSERDRLSVDLFLADTAAIAEEERKVVSTAADPHFDSLQYIDSAGVHFRLPSNTIELREATTTSIMPSGLESMLSIDDLHDLVTFLAAPAE